MMNTRDKEATILKLTGIREAYAKKNGSRGNIAAKAGEISSIKDIIIIFSLPSRSTVVPLRSVSRSFSIWHRDRFLSDLSDKNLPIAPDMPIAKHVDKPILITYPGCNSSKTRFPMRMPRKVNAPSKALVATALLACSSYMIYLTILLG